MTLEIALRRDFDYSIPVEWRDRVQVGSRVKVPFGPRLVLGLVTALVETSPHPNLKPITRVLGEPGLVTPEVLSLARWIGEYYCCPVELALKSVLPESVRREKDGWKERLLVRIQNPAGELPKLTKRQEMVWRIVEEWRDIPLQELVRIGETTADTVRRLEDKGLVSIISERMERDPYGQEVIVPTTPLILNPRQSAALATITAALDRRVATKDTSPAAELPRSFSADGAFLLHGVTGSGKTEVYLQALAHALERGRGGIVLVPEISLTPQTVERFKARFSSGPVRTLVAVLHSHLGAGERHDEWHKIRSGRARIVIGARSAIFAPVSPLGLIIVDEEHEGSYKQEETPRYHARDVAVVRAQRENAVVVLGSATPSLESYYNARRGKYSLIELPDRVTDTKLPLVRVVDLREAGKSDKGEARPMFSPRLREAITQRLERKEQTILFLNRRGYSASLLCEKCGYVAGCPQCSVSLTYHRADQRLLCHVCAYEEPAPGKCPQPNCGNPAIRFGGLGTERVEATLLKLFPKASIQRMDSDTLKRKEDYRRVLTEFRTGQIDILVGTQMIAKGLHFPNVTLVGIVHADLSLHLPDFRAGERTFQLLTQVSGRAGRGDVEGEVFVQTFTPFHPAIQYARRHDFMGFYEQEIEFREQLLYPPYARIALLTIRGKSEDKVSFTADYLRSEINGWLSGWKDLIVAGPAPAPLARAEGFFRYQIMIRTKTMSRLSLELAKRQESLSLPEGVALAIDIDPASLS